MRYLALAGGMLALFVIGCSHKLPAPERPIRIAVAPIMMDVEIPNAAKIHTFEEAPEKDREPAIRAELIQEAEVKAQRYLITELSEEHEFEVVPFNDARRVYADIALDGFKPEDRFDAFAEQTNADIVLAGHIKAYGQVPLKVWLQTYAVAQSAQIATVTALSGGNPVVVGGWLAWDLLTDIPEWTGGFHLLGWAYRPVYVEIDAFVRDCDKKVWSKWQVEVLAYRALMMLPKEERAKKHVQLEINLQHAMEGIARAAAKNLRLTGCPKD